MFASDDRLLYVLSARREVSWSAYKAAFDALHGAPGGESDDAALARARSHTAHTLDALGHCDVNFDEWGGRVTVAPAALARLPRAGLPEAVLVGTRAPETIAQLTAICTSRARPASLSVTPEQGDLALIPARVVVQADDIGDLAEIAHTLDILFTEQPPAWVLAHFSGSLDAYLERLDAAAIPEPEWRREDFDPISLRFRPARQPDDNIRLSRYSDPERDAWVYLLWRDGRCVRPDRDWGRYAVLREFGAGILLYDELRNLLAVPVGAPLPRLLARALTLCAGAAPTFAPIQQRVSPGRVLWGYTAYDDVPEQVAELVAAKIGQILVRRSLYGIS